MKQLKYIIIAFCFLACNSESEERYFSSDLKEMNLLGKVKSLKSFTKEDEYSILLFNMEGKKVKKLNYNKDILSNYIVYSYNIDGLLDKETSYYTKGVPSSVYNYIYNQKKQLVRLNYFEFYGSEKELDSYDLYEYDSLGNEVKTIMYDSNIEGLKEGEIALSEVIITSYNNKNKINQQDIMNEEGFVITTNNFFYDDYDNLSRIENLGKYDNSLEVYKYTYNEYNYRKTQEYSNNKEKQIVKYDYKYNYDKYKNWTLKIIKERGGEYGIAGKREIEYYK